MYGCFCCNSRRRNCDQLVERLVEEANKIVIGNGLDEDVFLGPVIRDNHKERTIGYIDSGVEQGATLVRDGREDTAVKELVTSLVQQFLTMLQKK